MNIYHAQFKGRAKNVHCVIHPVTTYCYGIDHKDATEDLYTKWDHVSCDLKLTLVPVVKLADVQPGQRVYMVMRFGGIPRLIGTEDSHKSLYVRPISKEFDAVLGGTSFLNLSTGIAELLDLERECVIA